MCFIHDASWCGLWVSSDKDHPSLCTSSWAQYHALCLSHCRGTCGCFSPSGVSSIWVAMGSHSQVVQVSFEIDRSLSFPNGDRYFVGSYLGGEAQAKNKCKVWAHSRRCLKRRGRKISTRTQLPFSSLKAAFMINLAGCAPQRGCYSWRTVTEGSVIGWSLLFITQGYGDAKIQTNMCLS